VTNVKTIFNKNGGQLLNSGSLDFLFSRKAVIEFPKHGDKDMEDVELELIDHGLEELSVDDEFVTVIGDYTAFAQLSQAVEDLGIKAAKSTLQYIPNQPIEINDEQIEEIEAIVDALEDDDDVQAVYTNLA
jgi:transcriptional/translational regulatory protein YebC/TACO1